MCIVYSVSVGGQQREREGQGTNPKHRCPYPDLVARCCPPTDGQQRATRTESTTTTDRPTDEIGKMSMSLNPTVVGFGSFLFLHHPFPTATVLLRHKTHTHTYTHTHHCPEREREADCNRHKGPTASTTGDPDHNDKETLTDTEFLILGCLLLLFLQLLACFAVFSFTSLFALASFRLFRLLAHFLHFFVFDSWKKHERYNTTDRRCGLVLFVSDG